jgi:PAS domain S-box-containing protein
MEQVAPGMRASVLLMDADGVTLRHGSAPHLPEAYSRQIDGLQIAPTAGSCGTAAWRRERVIVSDISRDPLWADYRAIAEPFGLAACWSTPILDDEGSVLGTFAMYYDEPRAPRDGDLAIAETATMLAKNILVRARTADALLARTQTAERLAAALRESEARFRTMAEAIPVQVWTAKPDGLLDFVTSSTAAYFGRSTDDLIGRGWLDIVHHDDAERATTSWQRSIETSEPYEVEFRLRCADGAYRWQLVRANPVFAPNGCVSRWFGCTVDIEHSKKLEAALDDALADARSANRAKAEFLAMMSHELRTPLNAINGYAQLMLEGIPNPPTEGQRNYLNRITRSQEHLLSLIEAVLTHAKMESGKVSYRLEEVTTREVIDVVDPLTAPQRQARGIEMDCTRCNMDLVLHGDREKIVQILLNVLSNASKFTPPGGRITIVTGFNAPGMAEISVSDTGVGMSPGEVDIVFEPFVQFDNTLSRENRGTGLGMPISRDLARGMGGDLVATSIKGNGSTFTLILPLAETAPSRDA